MCYNIAMQILLKIYLAGLAVLIVAILLNGLANLLHLATWYSVLNSISEIGLASALRSLKVLDFLFLLLVYPFLLGLAAYLVFRLF